MGFFEQAPRLEVTRTRRRRPRAPWEIPQAAIPAPVPIDPLILVRTEDVVLALTGLAAYPNGCVFSVWAVTREEQLEREFTEGWFFRPRGETGEPLPDAFLRLGISYADGRTCSNLAYFPGDTNAGPRSMLLTQACGGGPRAFSSDFWLWPLPPVGTLTFVCQWPIFEVPETSIEIDAGPVVAAAGRALQAWPEADETQGPLYGLRVSG